VGIFEGEGHLRISLGPAANVKPIALDRTPATIPSVGIFLFGFAFVFSDLTIVKREYLLYFRDILPIDVCGAGVLSLPSNAVLLRITLAHLTWHLGTDIGLFEPREHRDVHRLPIASCGLAR
jgi:hypothetical protein